MVLGRTRTSPGPAPPDRVSAVWSLISPLLACSQTENPVRLHVHTSMEYTVLARRTTKTRRGKNVGLCPPLPDPPSSLHPQVAHRTLLLHPMGAGVGCDQSAPPRFDLGEPLLCFLGVVRLKLGVEVRGHDHEVDQRIGIAPGEAVVAVSARESLASIEVSGGTVEAVRQNRVVLVRARGRSVPCRSA